MNLWENTTKIHPNKNLSLRLYKNCSGYHRRDEQKVLVSNKARDYSPLSEKCHVFLRALSSCQSNQVNAVNHNIPFPESHNSESLPFLYHSGSHRRRRISVVIKMDTVSKVLQFITLSAKSKVLLYHDGWIVLTSTLERCGSIILWQFLNTNVFTTKR